MTGKILNLFKIKVLAEVCKCNSYRIASGNLFITPSAVSKIIKELEADWGLQLVESTGNHIRITPQAEQLSALAAGLLQANHEFVDRLSELSGNNPAAVLRIGSGGSHTRVMMNKLLTFLAGSIPGLEYEVVTKNTAEVLAAVEKAELDCGIVSGIVPDTVDKQLIYEDNLSLYAYHQHPLASGTVSLKDLNYPICLREKGSSTRYYTEQFLAAENIRPPQIRQIGKNDELTDHLCRTENALQFLSDFYYRNSSWNKEYVKVRCAEITIPISVYFINRRNFPFARIIKLIRKQTFQQEISAS